VFAARQSGDGLRGLPRMEVHGLHNGDARALLSSAVQFTLDTDVVDRIVAETRGNPLALLELPQGRSATDLAGGFGLLAGQELSGRIEESFSQRLESLPDDTRRLLLVAAAEPVGDPLLLWAAVERLGVDVSSWDAVETGGLLQIDQRVTFRHPLARSAVYRSAPPHERRAAHLALAEVTDRDVDPDRRAWHLASAAAGPDEVVAVELERSADRAQARGGLAAAAAFLQRAVALTRDPQRRGERALVAADISLQAGAVDAALRLLAIAQAGPLDEMQQVRLDLVRAEATYAQSRGSDAPSLFLRAAKALERLDPALARETYVGAWSAALFAGGLATTDDLQSVSRAALAGPATPDPPTASDLLLDGLSLAITEGRHAGTPLLQQATSEFVAGRVTSSEVLRWGWLAGLAAATVWDFDTILLMAEREVANARKAGALTVLALAANVLAQAVALCGDFAQSGLLIAEADAVTDATNSRIAPYGALVLAALQGREADGSALIETTIAEATAGGQGVAVQYAQWAAAVLFNGLGQYERARDAARVASADATELYVAAWATSELVEAASRAGDRETACDALAQLTVATAAAETDWAVAVRARARALLSEGDAAEHSYCEAIDRYSQTRLRPEVARTRLLYGEWLRREGRRVDARAQLRLAHDMCSTFGMEAFAERARIELQATGETVRSRSAQTRDDLTAQELQIAILAGDGLSNPEIGARLFLSPRTVEWHLRKVFGKLDIKSRRELVRVLPRADAESAVA
jgi:DNA-binding CsgD family transcriptional regulator